MESRRVHRQLILIGFIASVVITAGLRRVEANVILTPAEINLFSLNEAAIAITHELALALGTSEPPADKINYSGAFSDSGWSMTMSGTVAALAVNLSFNASFEQGIGSFTQTGSIGTISLGGAGTYTSSSIENEPCLDWSVFFFDCGR